MADSNNRNINSCAGVVIVCLVLATIIGLFLFFWYQQKEDHQRQLDRMTSSSSYQELNRLRQELERVRQERTRAEAEREAMRSAASIPVDVLRDVAANPAATSITQRIAELQRTERELRAQIQTLTSERDLARRQRDEQQAQVTRLQADLRMKDGTISSLQASVASVTSERDGIVRQRTLHERACAESIAEKDALIARLRRENTNLRADNSALLASQHHDPQMGVDTSVDIVFAGITVGDRVEIRVHDIRRGSDTSEDQTRTVRGTTTDPHTPTNAVFTLRSGWYVFSFTQQGRTVSFPYLVQPGRRTKWLRLQGEADWRQISRANDFVFWLPNSAEFRLTRP